MKSYFFLLIICPISISAQHSDSKKLDATSGKGLTQISTTLENKVLKPGIDFSNCSHQKIIITPADSLPLEILREHMMIELNHVRDSLRRIGQVVLDAKINACVQEYAIYMDKNNHFKHEDKEGHTFVRRLNRYGFNGDNCSGAREVLGLNQKCIKEIMDKRLNKSEGHREALLRNGINKIGVGYYRGYRIIDLVETRK